MRERLPPDKKKKVHGDTTSAKNDDAGESRKAKKEKKKRIPKEDLREPEENHVKTKGTLAEEENIGGWTDPQAFKVVVAGFPKYHLWQKKTRKQI